MTKMVAEPLSISALSVLSGRDRRTVAARLKNVKPADQNGKSKLYSPPEALAAIFSATEDGALDHTQESARLKKAQADKTELEVAVLRHELIPAGEVKEEWADLVSAMRAKMLSLPSTAAVRVVGLDLREIESTLKELVYNALGELRDAGGTERRSGTSRDQGARPGSRRAAAESDN